MLQKIRDCGTLSMSQYIECLLHEGRICLVCFLNVDNILLVMNPSNTTYLQRLNTPDLTLPLVLSAVNILKTFDSNTMFTFQRYFCWQIPCCGLICTTRR